MNTRFRLHDHAFTRLKVLGMPLAVLETLLHHGIARRLSACWEVAVNADSVKPGTLGRFAGARVLISDDGRVLDIEAAPLHY